MKFMTLFLQAQATGQTGSSWTMFLMLGLVFVVMYLFMVRPQQKKQKEINKFRDGLKKGDKVVTIGGIYGKIVEVNGNTVLLEIDNNVKIKVDKASLVADFSDAQQNA